MKIFHKINSIFSFYRPYIPQVVDEQLLIKQASSFFHKPEEEISQNIHQYVTFAEEKGYKYILGERKTLSFEEAYILYIAIKILQPANIVEIGTQYGKSTRRIIDIVEMQNLASTITCYDVVDAIKFVTHQEVVLRIHDLTFDFTDEVLEKIQPELIFLDAHPYELLKNVIGAYLAWSKNMKSVLAIHDCSPGLFRATMTINKKENVTSRSGLWERHVLSELFNVNNIELDECNNKSHKLRIFTSPHGIGLISPIGLFNFDETN
jgi:hypothetical protein